MAHSKELLSLDAFLDRVARHEASLKPPSEPLSLEPGQTLFVPVSLLRPGQVSFSYQTVLAKLKSSPKVDRAQLESAKFQAKNQEYLSGKSLFPLHKSALVVATRWGLVVVDGHHKVLKSLYHGAKKLPVHVLADYQSISTKKELWAKLEKEHLVLLRGVGGEKKSPPRKFSKMSNDPNRYFAGMVAVKLDVEMSQDGFRIRAQKGAPYALSEWPLYIKVNRDIPFIEFEVGLALHQEGVVYLPEWGDQPPASFLMAAREALKRQKEQGNPYLQQVVLIEEELRLKDLDLNKILGQKIQFLRSCQGLLAGDNYF